MEIAVFVALCMAALAVFAVAGHLRDLVRIGERMAKDIKATADAEVARRKEAEKPMLSPADSEKEYARRRAALLADALKAGTRTVQ